jgi:hypothetical protein
MHSLRAGLAKAFFFQGSPDDGRPVGCRRTRWAGRGRRQVVCLIFAPPRALESPGTGLLGKGSAVEWSMSGGAVVPWEHQSASEPRKTQAKEMRKCLRGKWLGENAKQNSISVGGYGL